MRRSILFLLALPVGAGCTTSGDDCAERDWYLDADGDGFGRDDEVRAACERPPGYAEVGGDCNDGEPAVRPGAVEACNGGRDDDCDGLADDADDDVDGVRWFLDRDGDGFGSPERPVVACTRPDGALDDALDCDDDDPEVNPAATERCNGVDDDCDPETVEGGVWFQAASGAWTDETAAFAAATAANPVDFTAPGDGALYVCPGTWYAWVRAAGTLEVVGPAGAEATVLDAGLLQTGVRETVVTGTAEAALRVAGVTLRNTRNGIQHGLGTLTVSDVRITRLGEGGSGVRLEDGTVAVDGLVIEDGFASIALRLDRTTGTIRNLAVRDMTSTSATVRLLLSELALEDVEIVDSVATTGGGLAIRSSVVEVTRGTIARNEASRHGGGVYVAPFSEVRDEEGPPSRATLTEVVVSENVAVAGGGLYVVGTAELTLAATTLGGNTAISGGGVYLDGAIDATFTSSTLAENAASFRAGGIFAAGEVDVALLDSVVEANHADDYGGGVLLSSGELLLERTILSGNTCGAGGSAGPNILCGALEVRGGPASVRCLGSPEGAFGFFRNVGDYVVISAGIAPARNVFDAVDCDFGTGASDNEVEVAELLVRQYADTGEEIFRDLRESLGDDETFCSGSGCP